MVKAVGEQNARDVRGFILTMESKSSTICLYGMLMAYVLINIIHGPDNAVLKFLFPNGDFSLQLLLV